MTAQDLHVIKQEYNALVSVRLNNWRRERERYEERCAEFVQNRMPALLKAAQESVDHGRAIQNS